MTNERLIRAIVVEDSKLAREGLIDLLKAFPLIQVVGAAEHPDRAVELIADEKPELLFLDVHMPGQTGFQLLGRLDYEPLIIFTTAYSEYAIRSFEFQTVDYLLKPISQKRLEQAVERLKNFLPQTNEFDELEDANQEYPTEKLQPDNKILVKNGDDCHLVTLSKIKYFESCKNYVRLFFESESAFIKKSLNQVEERLPSNLFFRCSRQHIINLNEIEAIEEWLNDGFIVTLSDGVQVEISRRNAGKLKAMLSF